MRLIGGEYVELHAAGNLEVIHKAERLGAVGAAGQEPVIAQDHRFVLPEIGDQAFPLREVEGLSRQRREGARSSAVCRCVCR